MQKLFNYIVLLFIILIVCAVGMLGIGFYLSPQDVLEPADAVVAISGGETDARIERAIELYQDDFAPLIIFSGDALDPWSPSNAKSMKEIAVRDYNIPAVDIIIEEESASTYENALNLKTVFEDNNIESIILVTSPYHQRRSKMTFQYVMGDEFKIINQSSTDEFWRKIAWWGNDRGIGLTLSELWKIIYIQITGEYQ